MARYELLLMSRNFQHPRQYELVMSGRLSGEQMASLLQNAFPEQYWYCGDQRLESVGALSSHQRLVLSDLPQVLPDRNEITSGLKLYVVNGRDAGAWLPMSQGEHILGRQAPLWLEDPLISRRHATLSVTKRQIRLVAAPDQKIFLLDGTHCSDLDLGLGSQFRLGNTCFAIGDPLSAEAKPPVTASDLEVHVPTKPEVARLVALVLAALVPLLTGVLLAFLTGSMLFLILSGVSALMGIVPASQIISEHQRWKKTMRQQRALVIEARTKYVSPLGQCLVAGLDGASLSIRPSLIPPLAWGEGLWFPQSHEDSTEKTPRSLVTRLRRPKLDAPLSGPVFAHALPGVWQLVADQGETSGEVIASVLARFLPMIHAGKLSLIIDPTVTCLPASILLMDNVRVSKLSAPTETSLGGHETPELKALYLTAAPLSPIPDTLVIGIRPVLSEHADHWIVLNSLAADLPDPRFTLQSLHRLNLARFNRVVQQFVDLRSNIGLVESSECENLAVGIQASVGANDAGQEIYLDFDIDGPHILICGTTGSGKSEALGRIISDLTHRYSPEQLGLALIDFKGGAGLGIYMDLPHVQLFSSDLDEAGAQRTLEQLEHEVRRREQLLLIHDCSDLNEYQKLSSLVQPLPRLLVIVDEYRVFIETLPLAGPRIERLAAVGRALGIHLLLSTQRPAGALTAQIRANINTVIALRVNDPSEAIELVGTTDPTRLVKPGQGIIKRSANPAQLIQFHLAVEPSLDGELFARNRHDMALTSFYKFESPAVSAEIDSLRSHVSSLAARWETIERPETGFAPELPRSSNDAVPPACWPSMASGSLYCGVRDNLQGGTLEPLIIDAQLSPSILICGLHDAGAKQVLESVISLPRRILCFGPLPVHDESETTNLRVVSGEDPYDFLDALDFLESAPDDPTLIILIHSLGQLQAVLHPIHFQRFDDAVGAMLRHHGENSPLVISAVDRDQNTLKSTGLFTTQWYFPLNATDSLRMMWPKLPPCAQLPGRGVEVCSSHPPQVFQLTRFQAHDLGHVRWDMAKDAVARTVAIQDGQADLLGYVPFTGASIARPQQSRLILLCPNVDQRRQLSFVLAKRWSAGHVQDIEELLSFVSQQPLQGPEIPGLLCIHLESTADTRLAPALAELRANDVSVVLFAPPTSRLAYDLGMSAMTIDDRELIVVEAEHPQDMQPLPWPALRRDPNGVNRQYWRAIISRNGQPRLIHIPRDHN